MLTTPLRLRPTVCFCLLALPALARAQTAPGALPTGASVAGGAVTLRQDAGTLRVNQTSDKAIVNWNTFNIGRDAAVQFVQPGAGSTILNRVASGPSDIAGKLTSNGQVYLLNPNGVLFSPTARVDVGSLVAAAGVVSDSSFLAGAPHIAGSGAVTNAGTLTSADGGSVVLAGASVANSGSIVAPRGAITLAAGDAIRINLSDDGLIQAQVTLAAPQSLVASSGSLHSEGGSIALAASSAAGAPGGLVIHSGVVRAGAVRHQGGTVSLIGGEVQAGGSIDVSSGAGDAGAVRIFGDLDGGSVRLDARIDARGAGSGGMVETSAAHVQAGPDARVATLSASGRHGTWLIDPQDYTIGAATGDDISGASLSANLELGNVTIQSVAGAHSGAGDIKVNAPISWSAGTTLTLTAANSIMFASGPVTDARNPNGAALANLNASGDSAGLAMNFTNGYYPGENKLTLSGASPAVAINGVPYTVINAYSTPLLDAILRSNLAGNFVLTEDIDAVETAYDDNGQGWLPLGSATEPFSGQLHGFGHVVSDLTINRPGTSNVGLISVLTGTVRDLGLLDPHISGGQNTGALVGTLRYADGNTLIRHAHVAGGSVSGTTGVGGLAGLVSTNTAGTPNPVIDGSYTSNVIVTGSAGASAAALAGSFSPGLASRISNSFYNADEEVSSGRPLGLGAVFGAQFSAWLAGGRSLHIADYAASLPFDANSGSYQLSTLQGMRDLLGFANAGLKFRLGNDLDLANAPGLYLPVFAGEFDGANHTVSNLNLNAPDRVAHAGLVGLNTGTIKNLNVANAHINGHVVGGIAGGNMGTIQNTSVSGTLSGTDSVGGLVGFQMLATALLADSVSTASITGSSSYGGVIGDFDSGTLRNTHYDADTVLVNGTTSSLSMGGLRSAQYNDWISGGRTLDIANYSGLLPRDSASGAYLVSSVAGVNALLGFVDRPDLTFRLGANIDLAPAPGLFLPYLMGTLDGNGHQISNLSVNEPNQQYIGLVGVNYGTVRNIGASNVALSGFYDVGGLVGRNHPGALIENSFTSGTLTSASSKGGIAGNNRGTIANTYSNASILGTGGASGGLAGFNSGTVSNSVATGAVSSATGGGLVGSNGGTVTNSFWNTETTGRATSQGGTGKTTAELQAIATYTGWDFAGTWRMVDGTPSLRPFTAGLYDLVIDANDLTVVYGAGAVTPASLSVTSTGLQGADSMALLDGTLGYSGSGIGALNAGSYSVLPGGLTSTKYDVFYTPGTVTIDKAPLALTAASQSKTYGDADPVLTFGVSGLKYSDTSAVLAGVTLSAPQGAAAVAGTHAIDIGGGSAVNYTVASRTPGVLTVAASALVLTADDKSTTLGSPAPALSYSASGLRYADTAALVSGVSLSADAATAGTHPIVISGGDAGPNYSISRVNGTLSVGAGPVATPVAAQSLAPAAATVAAPRVPDASAAGAVALAASVAAGVTPQRKLLFAQASDAITRDPGIGTLNACDDEENRGECIAKPRTAFQAQVAEDMGAAAPAMHIKRKLALVIGNNTYHSPLSQLDGAGNDAGAIAALLRQQGYQVDQLANAGRSAMIGALNRLIVSSEPADSVLVFYAGHGYIHPGSSVGYWLPTDAHVDDPRGWLSNIDIARFLANIPARQLLLVSDSCFSGALTREGVADQERTAMSRNAILMRRSVVAMSSGGEEVVLDSALDGHSPFTYHLLRQLQASKGEIPAKAMLLAIRDKVSQDASQVPAYGIIVSSGHTSGGEYLLNPNTD